MTLADAISDLHFPITITTTTVDRVVCDHCHTGDPYCTVSGDWPCPTMEIVKEYDEEGSA